MTLASLKKTFHHCSHNHSRFSHSSAKGALSRFAAKTALFLTSTSVGAAPPRGSLVELRLHRAREAFPNGAVVTILCGFEWLHREQTNHLIFTLNMHEHFYILLLYYICKILQISTPCWLWAEPFLTGLRESETFWTIGELDAW
jgi:hypothetical protein